MDVEDDLLSLVGRRVARQRATLGLTLEEVAARTGVNRAMISRIERGEVHASAVVLDRLCSGLGTNLPALFARDATSPLSRRADQPVWRDSASGYVRREVAPAGEGSRVVIVEVEFPAGAEVAFAPGHDRGLGQRVWVLEGEIEITTEGARHHLAAGDCLRMRPDAGNAFRNPTDRPARYAVILAPEPAP